MDLTDNLGMIRVHADPAGALVLTCTAHPAWECTVGNRVGVDTLDVVAQLHLRDAHVNLVHVHREDPQDPGYCGVLIGTSPDRTCGVELIPPR